MTQETKSPDSKRDRLIKQKEQIEAKLKELNAKEAATKRKEDARRKIIVGSAVLAHAALHPDFAKVLRSILSIAVTRDIDRQVIADFLQVQAPAKEVCKDGSHADTVSPDTIQKTDDLIPDSEVR